MTLLRKHTTAIRALLHGRTVTMDGRYVQLRDVALDWPPPQVPPLLVGARGPKTVALAAELADGVILDGDPEHPIEKTDFWTFTRDTQSGDPNWVLVATGSA